MVTATAEKIVARKKLALVGNPNVGKSVIFNRLTGKYVAVSNYPGTTVDVSRGVGWFSGNQYEIVDTPGVNSLIPFSEDERVTRDVLLKDRPDIVVNILDAKNLRRALKLTLELFEYQIPTIVVLNLMDEAQSRGVAIDHERLSHLLGVPVIPTVATTGEGISELKRSMGKACLSAVRVFYPTEIQKSLEIFQSFWREDFMPSRAVGLSLLSGDDSILTWTHLGLKRDRNDKDLYKKTIEQRASYARPPRQLIFNARETWASETVAETTRVEGKISRSWAAKLGNWCMRPWPGYAIALFILYVVYKFVGVFGAGTMVDFLESTVFGEYITPSATKVIETFIPLRFIQEMLVGPYGIISMALTYAFALILPIVATFFIAFGLLEDSGYLPRLSVMLDRVFRLMGLNGRAVLPMILGLGCDTMATMTTRILDTKKERLIMSILLSLSVPCSAQLAVILGMAAGMSAKILVLWLSVVVGTTFFVGWASSIFLPGSRAPFLMEIPPIRRPLMRNVFLKMKSRLKWYMMEVVPLFIWGTLLLFFLDKFHVLTFLQNLFSPIVQSFLGLPVESTQAFIIGFLRRDYGAAGLYHLQKQGLMNIQQIVVSLILITLFMPCIAQLLMVIKERGLGWAIRITTIVLTVSIFIAGSINWILNFFPGILG